MKLEEKRASGTHSEAVLGDVHTPRASIEGPRPSLARRAGYGSFVLLSALVYTFFFAILVGMDAGWSADEGIHAAAAWTFSGIVLVPLAMGWNAKLYAAAFWTVVASVVGLAVVLAIIGDPDNHGGQAGPVDPANLVYLIPILGMAALHPRRRELRAIGIVVRGRLLGIAVVMGIPGSIYAVDQALMQRNSWPPAADPHHNAHWLTSGALVAALVLVAIVSALIERGWQLPALLAAAGMVIFGAVSILYPDAPSSLGMGGGAVALAAGAIFGIQVRRFPVSQENEPTTTYRQER